MSFLVLHCVVITISDYKSTEFAVSICIWITVISTYFTKR